MKKLAILAAFIFCPFAIQAQEVFINADLVSSYIWRGMKNGNASVQPTLGVEWKGWTLSAWGSTEFRNENNEIDLTLEYEYKNLQRCLNNYFYQSEDEPFNYFHYTPRTTGHTFEAELSIPLVKVSRYRWPGIPPLPETITGKMKDVPGPVIANSAIHSL